MRELQSGLWWWEARHPEWTAEDDAAGRDWGPEVSSYAVDDGERLLLIDPTTPPAPILDLAADRETVEAPAGTLLFVRPESRRKATGDGTVLALGATPGEAYQAIDWGEAWPFHRDSLTAYGEQRYPDALEAVRAGLERVPDHPGLHYNYACFATRAGDTGDDTFAHLQRSVELFPPFREQARRDDDFAAVRHDPRFEEALR